MADPAPGADAPTERRHRRNDRKRRRVRRVAGGLGALVIVAALVVFATGIVHFGDDEQPSVANTVAGDSWKADYTDKVDAMMKTLTGPGRTVYWVGSPTLKDPKMDAAVVDVNAVAQDVAKQHGHVHYVDAYKLFSGADGTFSAEL